MKKAFIKSAIVLAIFGFGCNLNIAIAQAAKFDIMTYSKPQGYKTQNSNGVRVFTRKNNTTGKFSLIFLYPSTSSFGNANKDFDRRWNQLVGKQAKGTPQKTVTNNVDNNVVFGYSTITYEGSEAVAMLTTVTTKERLITVLGVTNDENGTKDYESFLSKVDIDTDSITASTPRQTTVQQPSNSEVAGGNTQSISKQKLVGYWSHGGPQKLYTHNYLFKADGTFKYVRASLRKDDRQGRYEVSGNTLILRCSNGEVHKHSLGYNEYGGFEIGDKAYTYVGPVNQWPWN
jgi:hypothetical protein